MLYCIAWFVHISGAMLFFACLGLEWLGLTRLRGVERVEQVREVGTPTTFGVAPTMPRKEQR